MIINKQESSLTGTTIENSDYGMKNNPALSVVTEVKNDDAYLTADAGKTHK